MNADKVVEESVKASLLDYSKNFWKELIMDEYDSVFQQYRERVINHFKLLCEQKKYGELSFTPQRGEGAEEDEEDEEDEEPIPLNLTWVRINEEMTAF